MSGLLDAISWFFSSDDVARVISLFLWASISAVLIPSFFRCVCKKPRYLDPLFSAASILTLNRVAFGVQALVHNAFLADCCHWSSIAGGAFYWFVILDYRRSDRV